MFFGALYRMPLKKIRQKMQTLVELLEIPSLYQRIGTMRYRVTINIYMISFRGD